MADEDITMDQAKLNIMANRFAASVARYEQEIAQLDMERLVYRQEFEKIQKDYEESQETIGTLSNRVAELTVLLEERDAQSAETVQPEIVVGQAEYVPPGV